MQLMMPVFWASEEGSLTHSLANKFKGKVYGAKYGMEAAVWGGVGLGGWYMSVCLVWVGEVVAFLNQCAIHVFPCTCTQHPTSVGLRQLCKHNFEHNWYQRASSIMPAFYLVLQAF